MRAVKRTAVVMMLSLAAICAMPGAQSPPAAADPVTAGLRVGDRAPGFALPDQNGRRVSLADLTRSKGSMIVFYRSAVW